MSRAETSFVEHKPTHQVGWDQTYEACRSGADGTSVRHWITTTNAWSGQPINLVKLICIPLWLLGSLKAPRYSLGRPPDYYQDTHTTCEVQGLGLKQGLVISLLLVLHFRNLKPIPSISPG
jgi:hypothetical protein